MDSKSTGIGILGCGNIASMYVEDLRRRPGLRLVGATDLDAGRAAHVAESFGGTAYDSLDAMLVDPEIELIANLTIHHAHYESTRQCLLAGRHVHSEKPIALTAKDAWDLVDVAEKQGVRLSSSPFIWLGPAPQALWSAVRSGAIGVPRMIYAEVNWNFIERWHPNPKPFHEVGAAWDVGVYPLTMATAMFGPVKSVEAVGRRLLPTRTAKDGAEFEIGAPDWSVAILELADGVTMRLTSSFYVGPSRQRASLEVHGDSGTAALGDWHNFDGPVEMCKRGETNWTSIDYKPAGAYVRWGEAIADMVDSVNHERPHRATGRHAAHIVDVLEAIDTSMERGGAVEVGTSFERPLPIMAGK